MPAERRRISIEDLWSLKRLGPSSLSPDGAWACATVSSYSMDKNEASSQLWLLSTDGRTQRQLTRGKRDGDAQWSPDGQWIAFIARRGDGEGKEDNEGQIYLIAASGGEARRLDTVTTGVGGLRWFPDSKRLAFVSWVWPELKTTAQQARRFKQDQDDKVRAHVVEQNHARFFDHWFARGRKPHIHSIDIHSGKVRDLFAGSRYHLPLEEPSAALFDISPDSLELAFTFCADPDPQTFAFTDIMALDLQQATFRSLTRRSPATRHCAFEAPRYSPDGRWIGLIGTDHGLHYNEQPRAWLLARSSGALRSWSGSWDRAVNGPLQWNADSSAVLFTAESAAVQPLFRLELLHQAPLELRRGAGHGGCATDLRVSNDGATLVYARSSLQQPPTLLACDADGSNERAIEHFNTRLLKNLRLGTAQSQEIAGFGGKPVQLWLLHPPGFKAGTKRRWPLMQVVHGGPHACWSDAWQWRWNMQLFAAAGYVVCGVNYHGSSGWGQAFLSSINGDHGRREYADVEAATDHLLASGGIDPQRVVATGGSYGGYMVAYMNGHAPQGRYQAYVCHAGGFDRVSMMGSDGYFWARHMFGAWHWEDQARVLQQSPHHFAGNYQTPTLVLHGEQDFRVPHEQALAHYNTLRARGVPARLVYFPDENHWISKPQNARLWLREFVAWCDRFTKGKSARKLMDKARSTTDSIARRGSRRSVHRSA